MALFFIDFYEIGAIFIIFLFVNKTFLFVLFYYLFLLKI